MADQHTPFPNDPPEDRPRSNSAGAYRDTDTAQTTERKGVGVYDRPESVPRARSPWTMTLLVVVLAVILAAVFFLL